MLDKKWKRFRAEDCQISFANINWLSLRTDRLTAISILHPDSQSFRNKMPPHFKAPGLATDPPSNCRYSGLKRPQKSATLASLSFIMQLGGGGQVGQGESRAEMADILVINHTHIPKGARNVSQLEEINSCLRHLLLKKTRASKAERWLLMKLKRAYTSAREEARFGGLRAWSLGHRENWILVVV